MFITTSRKADILSKKACKLFSIFFSDVKHIPRGKTDLKKLFEKSNYLGYKEFLIVSKNKDDLFLEIFNLKDNSYFLENRYKIKNLETKAIIPLSKIKKILNSEKPEFMELFEDKETDNIITIKKNNGFDFCLDEIKTGFSFTLEKV